VGYISLSKYVAWSATAQRNAIALRTVNSISSIWEVCL